VELQVLRKACVWESEVPRERVDEKDFSFLGKHISASIVSHY
jgi:hypothetical protein